MKRKRILCSILMAFVVLLLLAGGVGFWFVVAQRQYRLNRKLVEAISNPSLAYADSSARTDKMESANFQRAQQLIEAGADPNTLTEPAGAPSLPEFLRQLLCHSSSSVNSGQTAFLRVCGARWSGYVLVNETERMQLARTMAEHGANVNARYNDRSTQLMLVTRYDLISRMTFLLDYGASIDIQNDQKQTALDLAIQSHCSDALNVLLKHHANPNLKDSSGHTPLWRLLHHPEVSEFSAERDRLANTENIRLLRQAGATE